MIDTQDRILFMLDKSYPTLSAHLALSVLAQSLHPTLSVYMALSVPAENSHPMLSAPLSAPDS